MRLLSSLVVSCLLSLAACEDRPPASQTPVDEAAPPPAEPVVAPPTEPPTEPAAAPPPLDATRSLCVRSCIEQNQMVASAPEAIEMRCIEGCAGCIEACLGQDASAQNPQRTACDEQCAGGGGAP